MNLGGDKRKTTSGGNACVCGFLLGVLIFLAKLQVEPIKKLENEHN